jgi:hypothetical protein
MKSKSAEEWVKQACFYDDGTPRRATLFDIKHAVKLAEEDARERAVNACKLSCHHYQHSDVDSTHTKGNCKAVKTLRGKKKCADVFGDKRLCYKSNFIKYYDNE